MEYSGTNETSTSPITYISGGLLGDFIMQLSVVCENYKQTGRKGIVYMTNAVGHPFRRGLNETLNDIKEIVEKQSYIEDIKIHENDSELVYDINLSAWRASPLLFRENWHAILKKTYNISIGKNKWIENLTKFNFWENTIVLSISQERFPNRIDFTKVIDHFKRENVILLINSAQERIFFEERTGLRSIRTFEPSGFSELCNIIFSCKLFIGALSMPLTIAHAIQHPRFIGYENLDNPDAISTLGLRDKIPGIIFEI